MDEREGREQRETADIAPGVTGGWQATEGPGADQTSHQPVEFTRKERQRLTFLRWLYRTGRLHDWF